MFNLVKKKIEKCGVAAIMSPKKIPKKIESWKTISNSEWGVFLFVETP
jgi:hypothetical protein